MTLIQGKQLKGNLTGSLTGSFTGTLTLPGTASQYVRGDGSLETFPTIPTKTSDLTNDGEDGINPFITANDIPSSSIPTLQEVMEQGREYFQTIGDYTYIYAFQDNLWGALVNNDVTGEYSQIILDTVNGSNITQVIEGYTTKLNFQANAIQLSTTGTSSISNLVFNIPSNPINGTQLFSLPNDKPNGSYIIATTNDLAGKEPLHEFLTITSSRALLDSDHLKTLKIENTLTLTIPNTFLRDNFEVFIDVFPTYTLTWALGVGVTVSGNEGLTQEENTQSLLYKLGSSNAYRLIGQV